jgi:lipoyl-dependent peroxiredoxin
MFAIDLAYENWEGLIMDQRLTVRRRARSTWSGTVPEGGGSISVQSGAFDSAFTLHGRMDPDVPQTNPEELIGAAEAGCFTMSLASLLSDEGHPPEQLETKVMVQLEQLETGFSITHITLDVTGQVDGVDEASFAALAEQAKATCPISRALSGTEVTLTARLAAA